jgi:hypothetical protein
LDHKVPHDPVEKQAVVKTALRKPDEVIAMTGGVLEKPNGYIAVIGADQRNRFGVGSAG